MNSDCRLNADGGDGGSGSGLITLEDLEGVGEDQGGGLMEGSVQDEEEERSRLLLFWQNLGRGHRVEIPRDMAEPIQQLTTDTTHNNNRESIPFTAITQKEKCGSLLYEQRLYEKANWACVTLREDSYEQSICLGFMKIMRYICRDNSTGNYLGMTVPIVTLVRTDETQSTLFRDVTVAYYLPQEHQNQPPQPFDPDLSLETWPATIVYSRPFSGVTNESSILREIRALTEVLGSLQLCHGTSFIVAGYTSLAAPHRLNEIWFVEHKNQDEKSND